MKPSYRQIAELFDLGTGPDKFESSSLRSAVGETAEKSLEYGRQCLSEGDHEGAITHFRRAVEQGGPSYGGALGGAYEYADMAPQALRQYERALQVQEDPELRLGLSDLYKRYGRVREAVGKLEEAVRVEPNNAFVHFKLAEGLQELGQYDKALVAIQGAIANAPDEAFYHNWTGDLLIRMKRFPEALNSFRAAIELSPGDDYLYMRASLAFWATKREQEALKAIQLASDLDPDKALYPGLRNEFLQRLGQTSDAQAKLDEFDLDTLQRLLAEID